MVYGDASGKATTLRRYRHNYSAQHTFYHLASSKENSQRATRILQARFGQSALASSFVIDALDGAKVLQGAYRQAEVDPGPNRGLVGHRWSPAGLR